MEGMNATGVAVYTLSQGAVVYENGELKTVRGKGRSGRVTYAHHVIPGAL